MTTYGERYAEHRKRKQVSQLCLFHWKGRVTISNMISRLTSQTLGVCATTFACAHERAVSSVMTSHLRITSHQNRRAESNRRVVYRRKQRCKKSKLRTHACMMGVQL